MTTTRKVQLDRPGGLVAIIGPGYRAKCDHGTCSVPINQFGALT